MRKLIAVVLVLSSTSALAATTRQDKQKAPFVFDQIRASDSKVKMDCDTRDTCLITYDATKNPVFTDFRNEDLVIISLAQKVKAGTPLTEAERDQLLLLLVRKLLGPL